MVKYERTAPLGREASSKKQASVAAAPPSPRHLIPPHSLTHTTQLTHVLPHTRSELASPSTSYCNRPLPTNHRLQPPPPPPTPSSTSSSRRSRPPRPHEVLHDATTTNPRPQQGRRRRRRRATRIGVNERATSFRCPPRVRLSDLDLPSPRGSRTLQSQPAPCLGVPLATLARSKRRRHTHTYTRTHTYAHTPTPFAHRTPARQPAMAPQQTPVPPPPISTSVPPPLVPPVPASASASSASGSAAAPAAAPPTEPIPPPPVSPITPTLAPARLPDTATPQPPLPPPRQALVHSSQPAQQVAVPPPPPEPLDFDANPDVLALKSAISVLQVQGRRAAADMQTLSRARDEALADPDAFMRDLAAGKVKSAGDEARYVPPRRANDDDDDDDDREDDQGEEDDSSSSSSSSSDEDADATSKGSREPKPKAWTSLPQPQNVVRCPPINWSQYAVVGESLDKLHAEQVSRPTQGMPASIGTGGVYEFKGDGRQEKYLGVAAPYAPGKDRIDKKHKGKKS
ncbi:hypothetical protein JDV02_001639 [Purpureocillium takamizusanense]|uniref:Uncharacterized protein n=1 Tax=Purpureocillium takamizusanense TaxID=2060973 RepID=A0A9Q8Q7K1_9HYPO|nr:uncharacterized protein JDV02_001639 [Purpureocillium takamizusanense]UNI15068.1 hypothetical protein JDV02_001639 [Purpureocillium takamizusanense]